MSIRYQLFPRSQGMSERLLQVINCFQDQLKKISSSSNKHNSNKVLSILRPSLEMLDFRVEAGRKKDEKIDVPVLFGSNNSIDKAFHADAVSRDGKVVVEIEAGRAVANNQFLKDIFQACLMSEVEYLILAVRIRYGNSNDYDQVRTFLETLYISNRLNLPLKGIVLIGY